jgi:acetoin utilization protein AcuB
MEALNPRASCDFADAVEPTSPAHRPSHVAEVMRREFITISPDDSLLEAYRIMRLARLRHLLVARDGMLQGILSYRDLQDEAISQLGTGRNGDRDAPLRAIPVKRVMISLPYAVSPATPLAEAAIPLYRLRLGCLPVVEEESGSARLLGLLTESDLLRAAFDPWPRGAAG